MVGIEEKLKIQIVEHNNEVNIPVDIYYARIEPTLRGSFIQVFPIFIRNLGTKLKSGDDIVLVRFDSYADFLVPTDLQADDIERLDSLVE